MQARVHALGQRLRKAALWAAVLLVLALVFCLYLQPQFVIHMADQLWACF